LTLTMHWDGTQWSIVPSPNANSRTNYLNRVSAVASNDVWAVGYYIAVVGGGGYDRTLAEHWDGNQWSIVPSPNVSTDNNVLNSVSVLSSNDVWAVGSYLNNNLGVLTLVEHWDGVQWSVVSSPNPPAAYQSTLEGVSAVSPNDVWAVGWHQDNGTPQ